MLPDNEISYTPVVRSIVETTATVEVRQNGFVIYSTNVPPAALEITDIYPQRLQRRPEGQDHRGGWTPAVLQEVLFLPAGHDPQGNLRYGHSRR